MPTYVMKDPDGMEHEFICSIAAMEKKKVEGWITVFSPPKNNLIGHTGDIIGHTSQGWRDTLRRIKDNSPGSDIDTG